MSTDLKMKELNYTWLAIAMAFVIVLFFACGCTQNIAPQETERLRSHQVKYKAALTGSSIVYYRAADGGKFKVIGTQPSGLNTTDTVWTETKTTIEKY